ncbi:MAG: hypothetical protein M3441_15615 [Chloroflexota bacterium]|nr:hypothetical protein [Chloroflexota bacterium]
MGADSGPAGGQGEANEAAYMKMLAMRQDQDLLDVSRRLLDWARDEGLTLHWSSVREVPLFAPAIDTPSGPVYFVEVTARGRIDVLFDQLRETGTFSDDDKRLEILHRLNQIPGMGMPEFTINKRPTFSLNALVSDEAFDRFTSTFRWVAQQLLD